MDDLFAFCTFCAKIPSMNIKNLFKENTGIQHHSWSVMGHEIPLVTISGKETGPTLMLTGMLHQDELIGPAVFDNLLESLDVSALGGNILLLPVLSVYQVGLWRSIDYFHNAASESEIAKLKGGKASVNANRFFPGKADGNWMEKFSYEVTETFIKNIDVLIDFHCCRMIDGSFAVCSEASVAGIKLAASMGLDFVDLQNDISGFGDTMFIKSATLNKTSVLLEFPGHAEQAFEWSTDRAYEALLKALIFLEMIPGTLNNSPMCFFKRGDKTDSIVASQDGHFSARVNQGQLCKEGDLLGVLRKLNDFSIVKKYEAPYDGACAAIGPATGYSIVKAGEEVISYKKSYILYDVI